MSRAGIGRVALLGVTLAAGLGCGPRQTPEQRLDHIRLRHDIRPLATTTVYNQGDPTLLVDLMVVNQGIDPLPQLTVLVRVRGADGVEKTARRVSLDLSGIRPGVASQVSAALPGMELGESDEVTVELETNLPPEVIRQLPEYEYVRNES